MTISDLTALLPIILAGATALVVLIQITIKRSVVAAATLACLGLLASFLSLWIIGTGTAHTVSVLLSVDPYSVFVFGLILAASFVVAILACLYLGRRDENSDEFFVVLLIAVVGAMILASARHFVSLFLGLEVLTVSLYVMVGYLREEIWSLEAGVKYLILAAASSAFLLFGMALMYAETGAMEFEALRAAMDSAGVRFSYLLAGLALFLVGMGFKLAVVPFHMWTPDVYEGAPSPATAFVATVSKGAVVAVLLRFFVVLDIQEYPSVILVVALIAASSMFLGNFLALLQKNVKRLLAYSSIAHLGYVLVAFLAAGSLAVEAVFYYLAVYFITILGAFGMIALLSDEDGEPVALEDYRGLFWSRPWLAAGLSVMMLSLAGIPLTAGFVGKFIILTAGVGSALWSLVIILVVNSAIGIYYYARVVAVMFGEVAEESAAARLPRVAVTGRVILTALTVALLFFGIYPAPLLGLIRSMAGTIL